MSSKKKNCSPEGFLELLLFNFKGHHVNIHFSVWEKGVLYQANVPDWSFYLNNVETHKIILCCPWNEYPLLLDVC